MCLHPFSLFSLADPLDDDPSPCAVVCLIGLAPFRLLYFFLSPRLRYRPTDRCKRAIFPLPISFLSRPLDSSRETSLALKISSSPHESAFSFGPRPRIPLYLSNSRLILLRISPFTVNCPNFIVVVENGPGALSRNYTRRGEGILERILEGHQETSRLLTVKRLDRPRYWTCRRLRTRRVPSTVAAQPGSTMIIISSANLVKHKGDLKITNGETRNVLFVAYGPGLMYMVG